MSVRAWRFWRVMQYQGEPWLWSVFMDVRWPGPVLHADERPTWSSEHGIYAYRRPRRECEVARGEVGLGVRELGVVAGWVDLYGHVIEHADGYRAESALVTLLVVKDRALFPYVPVLERRYEVDAMMGVGPEAILP
ncbi:MAG TPA: hypothetical protein VEK78_12760 [Gemmatimonadales bacterium]|nr:hypothetical protein [Gemmatimonadales bacterium]